MFIHQPIPSENFLDRIAIPNDDFELLIYQKSLIKIKGAIQFKYLNQSFNASIIITAAAIQIKAQQGFAGITLNAPTISNNELAAQNYLCNGTLTKLGHQNIIWLLLDFIHLYNVLRFKPGTILALYRTSFSAAKKQSAQLSFGQIALNSPIAKEIAKNLTCHWKRKHKYEFSNPLDLLANVQDLLATYPLPYYQATLPIHLESVLSN